MTTTQTNTNKKSSLAKKGKKMKLQSSTGLVKISANYNNTKVTVTTTTGDVVVKFTAGQFQKGSRRSTPLAAEQASIEAAKEARIRGMKEVHVVVKGPGHGRDAAVKGLEVGKLKVLSIADKTGSPFNGCRPKKEKRV